MITGDYNEHRIYVDGQEIDLERSLRLANHSPTGLSWGYLGSGPSQTALALLLEFSATDVEALAWYREFKEEIVSKIPQENFTMSNERVIDWLDARRLFSREFEQGEH